MTRILKNYGISSIRKEDLAKEKQGAKRGIASLLEIVWKIGFPVFPYFDVSISRDLLPEDINTLKDWKFAIANHIQSQRDKG